MTSAPASAQSGTQPRPEFQASSKLGPEKTDAVVIACSDRRYRQPMDEFLSRGLGIANYDLIAVPGGAYILSFADVLPKQLKLGMQMVKLLMRNHLPPRIVLVAHQDCSRYREGFTTWLRRPGFSLEEKQRHDLISVSASLRDAFPDAAVQAFFAKSHAGDSVVFEPVSGA